jgi:hypothetical protein
MKGHSTNTVAESMPTGKGERLVKWSYTDTALYEGTNIIDMALQCVKELGKRKA